MSLNEDDFIFQKAPKEQFKYNSILKMIEHVLKYIYEEYNIKIERFTPHYLRYTLVRQRYIQECLLLMFKKLAVGKIVKHY